MRLIAFVFTLFTLFSCKKETPIETPVIIITPPPVGIKGEFMPLVVIKTTGTIVDEPKVKADMKIYVKDSKTLYLTLKANC